MPSFVSALVNVAPETNLLKVVRPVSLHQIVPSTLGGIVTQFYQRNGNKYQIVMNYNIVSNIKYLGVSVQAEAALPIVVNGECWAVGALSFKIVKTIRTRRYQREYMITW